MTGKKALWSCALLLRTYPVRPHDPDQQEAEREVEHAEGKIYPDGRPSVLPRQLLQPGADACRLGLDRMAFRIGASALGRIVSTRRVGERPPSAAGLCPRGVAQYLRSRRVVESQQRSSLIRYRPRRERALYGLESRSQPQACRVGRLPWHGAQ